MFNDINLRDALIRERELAQEKGALNFVHDVFDVLNEEVYVEHNIRTRLANPQSSNVIPQMKIMALDEERLFSIDEIRKTCIKCRLRFLDSEHFKGDFLHEAVAKIKQLERTHSCVFQNFKIVASSEMFKLEDCDKDPLLFVQLDNGIYYLIHQWGRDMSWFRKLLVFPIRNLFSLIASIFFVSALLSFLAPTSFIEGTIIGDNGFARMAFWIWAFVSMVAGAVYIGLAFLKNVAPVSVIDPFSDQIIRRFNQCEGSGCLLKSKSPSLLILARYFDP
ncbi:MAG: hypothetical protein ACI84C_002217 [Flavobacteriales bacterium]|jgi:hypothetical protein